MVLCRIVSSAGTAYLPQGQRATTLGASDFANLNYSTYDTIVPGQTPVKAAHIVELRAALNSLSDAAGMPRVYSEAEVLPSSLVGQPVRASDFVAAMTQINNVRTNPFVGVAAAYFIGAAPAAPAVLDKVHLDSLREALK